MAMTENTLPYPQGGQRYSRETQDVRIQKQQADLRSGHR